MPQYISKLILNGVTQMDVTQDTVASNNLLSGNSAHGADGAPVSGSYTPSVSTDFVVTIDYDSQDDTWKPDRTLAEIQAAYTAGKNIAVVNAYATGGAWSDGWYQEHNQIFVYTLIAPYDDVFKLIVYNLDSNGISIDDTADLISPYFETVTKTYTPTESAQTETVTFDSSNYNGLQEVDVTVNAISSSYVGSGITRRDSTDLSASGATVSVPSGYYQSNASKSVASGSATPAASITGTAATVSTGTNTLTLSKTVSNTPQVSAGYVSSGTAGNSNVSLTANVTTKAATTYHPSSSQQTIASGTYLTGAQTINAVTTANLTADNIKNGVTVTVGDSSDPDCVTSVTGTYSGGSNPVKTKTGTFTGNGTRTIDVACDFEPDLVYFTSDPGTSASSGTVAAIIARDMMAATRYRNNSTSNSHYAVTPCVNLNTSGSSYSWRATYANSKVTLYCWSSGARALLTNGRTYTYQFVKWTT